MSTWGPIYKVVRDCHYNAGNGLIQLPHPKTQWSRGHYGLSAFTMNSTQGQLWLDMCPLLEWLRPGQLRHPGVNGFLSL
jgi:hypothetical protein